MATPQHFLDLTDHNSATLRGILDVAKDLKQRRGGDHPRPLAGKMLAMIFDKPSTRTRVSFDVGMRELGGETLYLPGGDLQLGRGETIADTARVLSRYVDAIMIRTTDHHRLTELAEYAAVPVINGLTDDSHPCQIMADVMTYEEHKGPIKDARLAWTGDGNNVLTSFIHAASRFEFNLSIATPETMPPSAAVLEWAQAQGVSLHLTHDPYEAVADADCVIADTFTSMGMAELENEGGRNGEAMKRHNLLMPYQVDQRLMDAAKDDAIFMHCLPAHRGEEVTADVIDGPQSVVFDEAENRLHAQKGILAWCLG